MKKTLVSLVLCALGVMPVHAAVTSCGAGYYLTSRANIDGISAAECQKLWCRDLETGKAMGSGRSAASGYRDTGYPVELCDANNNCVECFGERRWCSGEGVGEWNPEYGAYTRGGGDNANFQSYQKGNCFAWRLEKPSCESGYTAILSGGEWVCTKASGGGAAAVSKSSSVRRTGSGAAAVRRGL